MDFEWALKKIKEKVKVQRKGWNGKGMYVELDEVHTHNKNHDFAIIEPMILIKNVKNTFNSWVPSVSDLFADDWQEYKEVK